MTKLTVVSCDDEICCEGTCGMDEDNTAASEEAFNLALYAWYSEGVDGNQLAGLLGQS